MLPGSGALVRQQSARRRRVMVRRGGRSGNGTVEKQELMPIPTAIEPWLRDEERVSPASVGVIWCHSVTGADCRGVSSRGKGWTSVSLEEEKLHLRSGQAWGATFGHFRVLTAGCSDAAPLAPEGHGPRLGAVTVACEPASSCSSSSMRHNPASPNSKWWLRLKLQDGCCSSAEGSLNFALALAGKPTSLGTWNTPQPFQRCTVFGATPTLEFQQQQ